jgi:GT2 family glycosyltransferase
LPAERYEVIVTDDAPEHGTAAMIAAQFPWARWVAGPGRGPAANRNNGVKYARGEWIAFTDDDCVPQGVWLQGFSDAFHDGCNVYEGKTTCEAGIRSPLEHAPVNLTGGYLWSCNFMVRRVEFDRFGGFDEAFPYPYMEDVDFRERLRREQVKFEFVASAVVDHPPRRVPSGWRLARYDESRFHFWYKSGNRRFFTPHYVWQMVNERGRNILRHRFAFDSMIAMKDSAVEILSVIVLSPVWEMRYRSLHRPMAS